MISGCDAFESIICEHPGTNFVLVGTKVIAIDLLVLSRVVIRLQCFSFLRPDLRLRVLNTRGISVDECETKTLKYTITYQ